MIKYSHLLGIQKFTYSSFFKIIFCLGLILTQGFSVEAQSDSYCGSTSLSVSSSSCSPQAGSTAGFSNDPEFESSCTGTEDDEGWYWLTGGSDGNQYTVDVTTTDGSDMVVTIVGMDDASCTNATEIDCVDDIITGTESITFTWSASYAYYYVQIYDYWTGAANFDICAYGNGGGSSCSDGIQNGSETGIDCGGPDCPPCDGGGGVNCTGPEAATDDCVDAPLVSFDQPYVGSTDCGFTVDDPYPGYGVGGSGGSCGTLENNSWISFVAADTDLTFDITVADITGSTNDPFFTCTNGVQFSLWEGSCGSLSLVSDVCENPVTDPNVNETNTFTLTGMIPGNTYYLMVDGYAGQECDYELDPGEGIVLCDNDLCANAESISCSTPNIINGLQCATSADADANCDGGGSANAGLWYSFSGNGDEVTLSVNNASTDFNANIHVYEGSCSSKTCVTGATGNGTDEVTFTSTNGTNYFIYIDGDGGSTGIYELSIGCNSATCPQDVGTFNVSIDGVDQGSSCGSFDLDSQSEIVWTSNGDQNTGGGANSGIVYLIYDTDPSGFDFNDIATLTTHPNLLGGDPDNTPPYTTSETNCAGFSGTNSSWPTPVYVVPVTADFASIPYTIDTDFDDCWDVGCITELNYTYTLPTYTCGDVFVDNGGATGDYCPNSDPSTTNWLICPTDPNDPVSLEFTSWSMENYGVFGGDQMMIYNGNDDSAPLIGTYDGNDPPGTVTSTAATGCLYITFESDGTVEFAGWTATVVCSSPACDVISSSCGATENGTLTSGTTTTTPSISSSCFLSYSNTGNWVSFVGDGNPATISTDNPGTNFDTQIHVYSLSGSDPCTGTLTEEGCNDDFGTGLNSQVTINTTNGVTYYIFIDGVSGALGNYELTISCDLIMPCSCDDAICGGANYCSSSEAEASYNGPGLDAIYTFPTPLPFSQGTSYTLCWDYTTSNTETEVGFVNAIEYALGTCDFDRDYHVYEASCGAEISSNGPADFGNGGQEYTVTPNTTYSFCVEVTATTSDCQELVNTYVWIYDVNGGGGGCGTCDIPCTESGMGSVATYDDRTYLSCWTPPCDIYGPTSFTNCFEANADGSGFLGFANQIQNSIPGCIDISFELAASGDCANIITPDTDNANGVGSGFNPEFSGLTPNGTYVLCVTYTLPDFLCGLDGADSSVPDFICIDAYGNDCSANLEGTSADGFACQNDGIPLSTTISWNQTAFDAGPNADGTETTGFLVFCSLPVLPMTQTYSQTNSLSAILEAGDSVGQFINNNGDYVDPISGQVCMDEIFLVPITISQVVGGTFIVDWTCFDTDDIVNVVLGVPPTVTATADPTDICDGESSELTATGGGTYQWSDGLGTSPVVTVMPTTTTTYTVTVTDDSGNCTSEESVTVNVSSIDHTVTNILCDDNGTPNDPTDDTFTFEVTVTGTNTDPTGWTANDASTTTGSYGVVVTFGPFNIADGPISFDITDNGASGCSTSVMVTPPPTCSDQCDIDGVVSNIVCNNNGTPSDDSDDTYTFDVTVTGTNVGATWSADDVNGTSGSYDSSTSFGPFDISAGVITIIITDVDDSGCTTTIMVTPPTTCSSTCSISNIVSNVVCDDNGTPSDPSDDTFTFDIVVSGSNTGAGWSANDPLNSTGLYTVTETMGPYSISGNGTLTFTITDDSDSGCTTDVTVNAPTPCSNECDINAVASNIICNDNGTPSDPSDDTYTFDVIVSGVNTGTSWTANDPNTTNGSYDVITTFGPYDISDGAISFNIIDGSDSGCTASVSITPPPPCSNECDIDAVVSNIQCDDNGTPSDPSDDTFTFDIIVSGSNTGSGWTANDPLASTGSYGATVTMGPYTINGNASLSFTITDDSDSGCTTDVTVNAPLPCSDECDIDAVVSNIVCDDNGTPSDPSDDTFTFDIIVNGSNVSGSWSASDPNSTTGAYGVTTGFGPYNISGGDLSFTITDDGDATCTTDVSVVAPPTCSDDCEIMASFTSVVCDNNGTPSDPDDDTFTFNVTVTGTNTGTGWTANDAGTTSGSYGASVSFGPFNIADGDVTITITDNTDSGCQDVITIIAPPTCSGTCSISNVVSNIICDDNGTPSDPSDDTYTFDIVVNGSNQGTSWSGDDPNTSTGLYGVTVNLGPFNIADGNLSFTITDIDDPACITIVNVIPPATCSDECDISAITGNIQCDDNGTPSDPSDDTYTFEVTVTGSNTGSSWNANDPNGTSGSYDIVTVFGPYNISDGPISFNIIDGNDNGCTASINITPPVPCSDECDISAAVANILCDDNGTPSDPSDDTYTFDVTVTGSNTATGWSADDPNNTIGNYDATINFGPYNIVDGILNVTITDNIDNGCSDVIMITPPAACSDECEINAVVSNIICDDNGTPSDPSDDTYTFDLDVSGSNVSGGWSANDPNATSGVYGGITSFGPYDISGGDLNFTITDNGDPLCSTTIMVIAPAPCSDECDISAIFSNVICDDNGTPSDPDDDTFTFTVNVTGVNTSTGWSSDDPSSTSGNYGTNVILGPFNIADGNVIITITDNLDPGCQDIINVTAPSTCSGTCSISNVVSNIICDDNGTPSDPSDDTFTFDIVVNGSNVGASWTADDPNGASGLYGVTVNLGPYNIADGNLNFTITDIDDPTCTTIVGVTPPMTCSDECDIDAIVANVLCDDNGTPSDPSDDTFTFEVTVSGSNTGSSWAANDPSGNSGSYDIATTFGPYNISDGILNFNIIDGNDNGCTASVSVTPPPTCSDDCEISGVVSNILCDDNGTPSDPSDDTFTFDLTVSGSNNGIGWFANDLGNTMGAYDALTTFGPFDISDGIITITITDDDDAACTDIIMITPPATCSDECEIITTVTNILCDDNGTPGDPSDDVFTFDVEVTGSNISGGWNASDPNATSGTYGGITTFGPFNIAGGDLSFTISDNGDPSCTSNVMVTAPTTCSSQCEIEAIFSNVVCNDSGTPSDPDDDTFTFNVVVSGNNTSGGWTANDASSTTGIYDLGLTFGPYLILDGNVTIVFTDDADPACQDIITVAAPASCSGTCSISNVVSNILCDDNGTPSDPSDDTYTFDIVVNGSNEGTSWTSDDPNGSAGLYGVTVNLGPYNISDGILNFTISDIDDPLCTTVVGVTPPMTCSDECEIVGNVSNILCDDNGTPTDPSDDTYTFDIIVSGSNTGSTWTSNDPNGTSGSYDITTTFGPYNIADGVLSFTIIDGNSSGCTYAVSVTPPATCSDLCEIDAIVDNIICDDNGTPSDPSDDTFTFEVVVSGNNTGGTWSANDPNNTTDIYDNATIFGPYPITIGSLDITITDDVDGGCTVMFLVEPPMTCSDQCEITTTVSNIVCDDNGTPMDPSDDTYTFDVDVSGTNSSGGWSASDPNSTSGVYGAVTTFGPYNISGGDLNFTITDNGDPLCSTLIAVNAPEPCSDECAISAVFSNVLCNDNGTPTDPDDDTYTFDVIVSGINAGTSWLANDPLSTSGLYDESVTIGPFNIIDGNVTISINDFDDPTCSTSITVTAPSSCSGMCSIANTVSNIECDDAGTPSDPSDDTYTFDIFITGSNTGGGWNADDPNAASGSYNVLVLMGPYLISDGNLNFTVTDDSDPSCTVVVGVMPPVSCSDQCEITAIVENILCNDNGTSDDPSDDIYTFDVSVTGSNTGSSWLADDPNNTSGSYSNVESFGPYLISDGDFSFTIADLNDPTCIFNVDISVPATCSEDCSIIGDVSNIECNDSGTPSDPSDDTYTFDVFVTGTNTGSSWIATDPNATTGTYNSLVTFGPYPISGGDINFQISDASDSDCLTEMLSAIAPSACSDACEMNATVSNIICNDNGTPSDGSDDVYFFDIEITGSNLGSGWTANDPNATAGIYSGISTFGPFNISGGDLSFSIIDNNDNNCSTSVDVEAPMTCSEECDISAIISNIICNDNGTGTDPTDDTFTFDALVTGTNAGLTWSANDINSTTGNYGTIVTFGPYNIIDGNLNIQILDSDNNTCFTTITVDAPNTCSGTCSIGNSVTDILCNDAGTPSDPSDDTFTFNVTVSGSNFGSNWSANDPNLTSGNYSEIVAFGPYPIQGGNLTFTIVDIDDPTCTTNVQVNAPMTCSDACEITTTITNIICDDAGTSSDASDDVFTFEITVMGDNLGSTWSATDPNNTSGSYFNTVLFGPYLITSGDLNFDIIDGLDGGCLENISVEAPLACSDDCIIQTSVTSIICNDEGTPNDPSDDTFTFELTASGTNIGNGWISDDPNTITGNYGDNVVFGPYPITGGNFVFSLMDVDDPSCSIEVTVVQPNTCSPPCSLDYSINNLTCNDNGTPTDPSDDTYIFGLMITGENSGSGWTANDPFNSTGIYGVETIIGPLNISDGTLMFTITDNNIADCVTNVEIIPPAPCSGTCSLSNNVTNIMCNDAGTPTDSSDDTFTFDVLVNGQNAGSGWISNDGNSVTGIYGQITTFGPYLISDGDISFIISDLEDANCNTNVNVSPPSTCSDACVINTSVSDIVCNDNGTPGDSSDDTFTFNVTVDGVNVGGQWTATDVNNTSGNYGGIIQFGPYLINDGSVNFSIIDNNDAACQSVIEVDPPSVCSGCILSITADSSDESCPNENDGSIIITPENANGTVTYTWNDVALNGSSVDNLSPGLYSVTVEDSNGCMDTMEFEILPAINFSVSTTADLSSVLVEEPVNLVGTTTLNETLIDIIEWTPNETVDCIDCLITIGRPIEPTMYTLTVVSVDGCSASDSIFVDIRRLPPELYVPNIFSPNNDGQNDRFYAEGEKIEIINSMKIFDRWGNLVFENANIRPGDQSAGWDGVFNGELVVPGVFVYSIEFTSIDGETGSKAGDVTVVR